MRSKQGKSLKSADECRAYCLRLLAARGYSEQELYSKLTARQAPAGLIEPTLARLREEGYINDAALAESLIHYRAAVSRHGFYAVKRELQRRGVEAEVAEAALAEEYSEETELEAACAYLRKQLKRLRLTPEDEWPRERLRALLAKRGFSSSVCAAALDTVRDEAGE